LRGAEASPTGTPRRLTPLLPASHNLGPRAAMTKMQVPSGDKHASASWNCPRATKSLVAKREENTGGAKKLRLMSACSTDAEKKFKSPSPLGKPKRAEPSYIKDMHEKGDDGISVTQVLSRRRFSLSLSTTHHLRAKDCVAFAEY
jgi:hypothetical protein